MIDDDDDDELMHKFSPPLLTHTLKGAGEEVLHCGNIILYSLCTGRLFLLDLRNSSDLQSFRDAERACATQHARLASAEELHHAVVECSFSACTRGWLYGGTVGTTVCNIVGSTLKAVDVKTENATEDTTHLDAFCVKDKDVPCGDPPSFPNTRLQGHTGFEMGDELLYTCVPGYVMPSGHNAFSLLCDSCGEWYGLVQICVKGKKVPEEAHGEGEEEAGGEEISVDEEEGGKVEGAGVTRTEAPVSLLSQKHLFWFPSEAFQDEGHPAPTDPITQTASEGENRVRASGAQSEESREYDSQEAHYQHPVDPDHEQHSYGDHDSHHDDRDDHDDSHHDDRDDHLKHYIPAQRNDLDKHSRYGDHDGHNDHYDMGEHEDERDRVHYGSQGEYDDQDESYSEDHDRGSYTDHDDVTEDHDDTDREHPDGSEEHPDHDDHDDGEKHYGLGGEEDSRDRYDEYDHSDHEHDDHDSYESHHNHYGHDDDSDGDGHQHVVFSVGTDERQNFTLERAGGKPTATTDETWLDGYPVIPEEADKGGSTEEEGGPEDHEREIIVGVTDRPNDLEMSSSIPYTSFPEATVSATMEPNSEQDRVEGVWPHLHASSPTPVSTEPSDSPSYLDTEDYDTQHVTPTSSWVEDATEHPFLDHGPAPPMHDDDIITGTRGMEGHTEHNLTGQVGERGEVEGEMGETMCNGDDCPPHPPTSSSRGPTVAAIIVAVCAVATAVIVGAWCYRRRQQKSSVYEMNGKGQSQSRHGQQIEMQQKV
uniref:Sushi domain containing 5 n=1 Tax=Myripristis murdjan TaxID=586833 RepID=A0A667XBV8_9TELE